MNECVIPINHTHKYTGRDTAHYPFLFDTLLVSYTHIIIIVYIQYHKQQ